jgi:o-succinylbenzoate synthase
MRTANYYKYNLIFKEPSGTSRGVLRNKETFILVLKDKDKIGIGECGLFRGLSVDDRIDYEPRLRWLCENMDKDLDSLLDALEEFPSIQFGLEQAWISLERKNAFRLFPSPFIDQGKGIPINGLIWMGSESYMKEQIENKLNAGFTTLKMKIGAIDFDKEIALLRSVRESFSSADVELRVDANGAFTPDKALDKLKILSDLDIHSIEQPIRAGQWEEMAALCMQSPLPIALDEELIGVLNVTNKQKLLHMINPQFIIVKPSLVGGYRGSMKWIELAEENDIGWWITSALESNIGLNAIAQWVYTLDSDLAQGLGTGSLFTNNISGSLEVRDGKLYFDKSKHWNTEMIFN